LNLYFLERENPQALVLRALGDLVLLLYFHSSSLCLI
jgi:hypothetical protein